MAKAYDAAGNVGTSATVGVSVRDSPGDTTPPTLRITSPTNGVTVGKTTKVSVVASDNVGVTRVDLLVDGKPYATTSSSTPTFTCQVFSEKSGLDGVSPHRGIHCCTAW